MFVIATGIHYLHKHMLVLYFNVPYYSNCTQPRTARIIFNVSIYNNYNIFRYDEQLKLSSVSKYNIHI